MKFIKTVIILFSISLLSCIPTIPGYKYTSMIDYSKYVNQGFFITESNSVSFEYDPIASMYTKVVGGESIEVIVEEKPVDSNAKYSARDRRGDSEKVTTKKGYRAYTVYDALDDLVEKCKKSGANGIINLNISYTYNGSGNQNGYAISGMAIKR